MLRILAALALLASCLQPLAQTAEHAPNPRLVGELLQGVAAKDGEAAMRLAEAYKFGLYGLPVEPDSNAYYINLGARYGNVDAFFLLGNGLLKGRDFPQDIDRGLIMLNRAADRNHALALQRLMEVYADTLKDVFGAHERPIPPNRKKALEYAERLAELNDPKRIEGALHAGKAYLFGWGTTPDDSTALAYLELAAEYEAIDAQLLLGELYTNGSTEAGFNDQKAYYYFKAAAEHPYASLRLRTAGKVGLHYLRQRQRQYFNYLMLGTPWLPPGAFKLEIFP